MTAVPSPFITPDNEDWAAAAMEGRLVMKQCRDCGRNHYYPRVYCPFCQSASTSWLQAGGRGRIYSFTVNRLASPVLLNAYVTLAEGPTIMTKIVDAAPEEVKIGAEVLLGFEDSQKLGFPAPVFTLVR